MSVDFKKINPAQLGKAAIVPQVLDNQWVPSDMLSKMIKERKGLSDVQKEREAYVLKEWRRALVYGEQVVVNRAFMFNNAVVVDDYDDIENRQYFKHLLNTNVIVPYFLGEDSPDQKPHFQVDDRLWSAWIDIINDAHLSCVRLDWDDQQDDFKRLSRIFHNYIQTLNKQEKAQSFASHFRISDADFPAFRERLKQLAFYAFQLADTRDIVRNDVYKEFIVDENSNVAHGMYSGSKPFAAEIKQIVDLKYNVNLPDALGRYAMTPEDSLPRAALGDLDEVIQSKRITNENVQEILYALKRLQFEQVAKGLYIKSLGKIGLSEVLKIRDTKEWKAYRDTMHNMLDNPLDFANQSAILYAKFESLNEEITKMKKQSDAAKWEPWVKFILTVGAKTVALLINPADPSQKYWSEVGAEFVSTGATPFLMKMMITTMSKTDADLEYSLDFMRGNVSNGRDTFNEIIGNLKATQGFEKLTKQNPLSNEANISQPEAF